MSVEIRDGFERMHFEELTAMLAKAAWCKGIGVDAVKRAAEGSALVAGAFLDDVQVGYARVISDKASFAYIADVYVEERVRRKGIAKGLLDYILAHESLGGVYLWLLKSEVNELYETVGFRPVTDPEKWMQIRKERPVY